MKLKLALLLIIISFVSTAQMREHAFDVNQRLGRGINYGNMFEAPAEQEWGNPWKPEYAGMIAKLGFNHIRIPIRWEPAARSSATPPYTINPTFLNRIKQVVDSALNNHLHAIINMHHHDELFANPDGQKERFLAQWKQISVFFKDYPDSLLFEILNEPNGKMTAEKWNVFSAEALATIREDNPDRIVLIATPEWGGLGGLPYLQLPDDENIILTVHYYNPFQYTHQGAEWVTGSNEWMGTEWNDSETERMVVQQEFAPLVAYEKAHNVPVHIGEFGSYSKSDIGFRKKWTTYISRYLETLNWSWAYWEFSAGFGIYNPNTKQFNQVLTDALLHNEMPEPAIYIGTPVYTSNFQNSNDGWNLYRQGTGAGQITRADNTLKADITDGSTETWHIQLVKNNFSLKSGKKYRFSFKAKSDITRSFNAYVGMSVDPWSSYSGYNSATVTDTFSVFTFVFDMTKNDNTARMVFDLGKSDGDFFVTNIKLEEVVLQWPTAIENFSDSKTKIFPNPVTDILYVNNIDEFSHYTIRNIQGATLMNDELTSNINEINLAIVPPGLYVVILIGKENQKTFKVLKN